MTAGEPKLKYPRPTFTEPMPYGYLYVGMRIDPPGRVPFVRNSSKRRDAIEDCIRLAHQLDALAEVVTVTVYEAVVIPPVKDSPRFDVIVLVQTTSPESIATVQAAKPFQQLDAAFVMAARNLRRIGDIDRSASGVFLFNHFTAADAERALRTWEDITGWFTHKASVSDSALLQPIGESRYVFVNHVRLPCGPLRFLLRFTKPSFRRFVATRLNANRIGNAPVLCRPV